MENRQFTLAITGDVMLGRLVKQAIGQRSFSYPFGDVLTVIQQADLALMNLECALTSSYQAWHDGDYHET